jgi:SAM-dependent methyltransferase
LTGQAALGKHARMTERAGRPPQRTAVRPWAEREHLLRAQTWLVENASQVLFERRLGTRTDGWIELSDLGLPSEHRVRYQPSAWLTLPRILRRSEISAEDVFVDFGCGLGRMVLEAAMLFRFSRVVGVELSPDLARVARENVERNRRRLKTPAVEIVVSDVLAYPIPDDVTIAFFNNPFCGPIFGHVIRGLLDSVDRVPRRLRIVYCDPAEEEMMLQTGRIRRVGSGRSFWSRHRVHTGLALYEVDLA